MSPQQEAKLIKFGIFTLKQAAAVGIMQPSLSRLVQNGIVQRIGRGLYLHPKAQVSADDISFHIACAKFGSRSAIGGLSALFYYNLIEQVPEKIWVIVPPEKRSREQGYRLIRTKLDLKTGIIIKDGYKIVSVERALLEALKMSSKIGERVVLKAVRTAIAKKQTDEARLGKMAKTLDLRSVLARFFEAIVL